MHFDKRMITLASMSVIIFVKRDLARAALCQHYRRLGFERRKGGNRAFKAFIYLVASVHINHKYIQVLCQAGNRLGILNFQAIHLGSFGGLPIGL